MQKFRARGTVGTRYLAAKPQKGLGRTIDMEIPESEKFEEKALFVWSEEGKQFDILKTIIAFANCSGGVLKIGKFEGDERQMDSARLDDFARKYVSPAIPNIVSKKEADGGYIIEIERSPNAPHVIKEAANYKTKKGQKPAFHRGQIYVRHSSKSEPATSEDLRRMIRDGVSSWLASLGAAVARIGVVQDGEGGGVPFRLVDGGPAINISVENSHPHTASDLGKQHGKTGAWIGKLINREGLRENIKYTRTQHLNSSKFCTFSDEAKKRVDELLKANPDYNPYAAK